MFLELFQQPRGLLDFVADDFAVLCWLFGALERADDGGELVEVAFECWRLLLLCFQKQFLLGEDAFAQRLVCCLAPGGVDRGRLACGPVLFGEALRHALTVFSVHSCNLRQLPHGDLRGDAAVSHLLLHRFLQCVDQRQAARLSCRV